VTGQQKIKGKEHLFFDLDHTLWDYETNSNETLSDLWNTYNLAGQGVNRDDFLRQFSVVNEKLWHRFHQGEIGKDTIRNDRFKQIFDGLDIGHVNFTGEIQEDYLAICPTKPHVIADAHGVLEALTAHYKMHIITNGFDEIQSTKLDQSGLAPYFDKVITSGKAGYQKPQPEIFLFALELTGATAATSIMIGDNPDSDIVGAHNAGIDQVFYNPDGLNCAIQPTAEITSLKALLELLI
jgi:putative hydrolase of the HAD superfamily